MHQNRWGQNVDNNMAVVALGSPHTELPICHVPSSAASSESSAAAALQTSCREDDSASSTEHFSATTSISVPSTATTHYNAAAEPSFTVTAPQAGNGDAHNSEWTLVRTH